MCVGHELFAEKEEPQFRADLKAVTLNLHEKTISCPPPADRSFKSRPRHFGARCATVNQSAVGLS